MSPQKKAFLAVFGTISLLIILSLLFAYGDTIGGTIAFVIIFSILLYGFYKDMVEAFKEDNFSSKKDNHFF